MKLYKYTQKEFVENFFDTGEIRLGTLSDFRKSEKYNVAIADTREGMRDHVKILSGTSELGSHSQNVNEMLSQMFNVQGGGKVFFHNTKATLRTITPDIFIYCATTKFNEVTMRDEFKCNGCIEITNSVRFFREITKALSISCYLMAQERVNYINTTFDMEDRPKQKIALCKESVFSYQNEFRAVWKPRSSITEMSPINICIPDARKYCKVLKC